MAKILKIYNFVMDMHNVLYIHGMGGGGDSRIPSILSEVFSECGPDSPVCRIVVRTYSFDPEEASRQIAGWVEELKPGLVIGESLGALHALKVKGIPHLFVSPALNAPIYFEILAWLSLLPGITAFFDRLYMPKEGDRQPLHFTFRTLRKYRRHRREALRAYADDGGINVFFAFFGRHDHYRRSGVVSIRAWRRIFGADSFRIYDGTHFMEDDFVRTMLADKIREFFQGRP